VTAVARAQRRAAPGRAAFELWATPLAVFYVLLWASAYVPSTIGARAAPPLWFLVARFFAAGLVMGVIALAMGRQFPRDKREWLGYAIIGVTANAAYLGFTYSALERGLASGVGSIVASTNPLLLALVAPRLLGEPLTWRKSLGLVIGFGGVVGVMFARADAGSARPSEVGLAFVGVISSVLSTLLFKRTHIASDLMVMNTIQLLGASLALVVPAFLLEGAPTLNASPQLLASFVYLVLVLSVGASLLWFWLLSHGAASRVSAFYFLTPIFGLAFGALFLGETIGPGDAIGLVAVALGIVLVQRG
jgi:drug/metabolite transporter (DMT)-like permease